MKYWLWKNFWTATSIFNIKDIPQGFKSFGNSLKFLVNNSNSLVSYPKFDLAAYFQISRVQYEVLQSAMMQLNQEVSTDRIYSENLS